eukprot:TRINITY_DN8292_c0_g1_i1.p1 TRINITY_DN8292_c0_g1~~TRINITY_DN8292_c0_g1_i1.p1  ORF type:complete len:689 (-),score=178.45 TRINITY_DN8292_c0_g1_i1:381-2447(-)
MLTDVWSVLFFVIGVIIEAIFVTYLIRTYADRQRTPWYALITVWTCWFLSFSIVFLAPLDIAEHGNEPACVPPPYSDKDLECDMFDTAMVYVWRGLYWTVFAMCWVFIPVMQSYSLEAHFTFGQKLWHSIKDNLLIYAAMGVVGLIAIAIMFFVIGFSFENLMGIGMAAASTYGLLIVLFTLGYGLFEWPKKQWRLANQKKTLNYYYFHIITNLQAYEDSKRELEATFKLIRRYDESIERNDYLRNYVDIILAECPPEYNNQFDADGTVKLEYEKVVALRYRLMKATMEYRRSRVIYLQWLRKTFNQEDVLNSADNVDRVVKWTVPKTRMYFGGRQVAIAEWVWFVHVKKRVQMLISILCFLASVAVCWSEIWCWQYDDSGVDTSSIPDLSVFSLMLKPDHLQPYERWFLASVSLMYNAYLCYWSLFQLRILNFYRLIPHQESDANSLLSNAYYGSLLVAPTVHNFLLMIHNKNATFKAVMRPMRFDPLFGKWAPFFFPCLLVLLALSNLFNLWSKLCSCGFMKKWVRRFDYDDSSEDNEDTVKGKSIVTRERELLRKNLPFSVDQNMSLLREEGAADIEAHKGPKRRTMLQRMQSFFKKQKNKRDKAQDDKIELLEGSRFEGRSPSNHTPANAPHAPSRSDRPPNRPDRPKSSYVPGKSTNYKSSALEKFQSKHGDLEKGKYSNVTL